MVADPKRLHINVLGKTVEDFNKRDEVVEAITKSRKKLARRIEKLVEDKKIAPIVNYVGKNKDRGLHYCCDGCNKDEFLWPTNWMRCNACEDFDYCCECFLRHSRTHSKTMRKKEGKHAPPHTFTYMQEVLCLVNCDPFVELSIVCPPMFPFAEAGSDDKKGEGGKARDTQAGGEKSKQAAKKDSSTTPGVAWAFPMKEEEMGELKAGTESLVEKIEKARARGGPGGGALEVHFSLPMEESDDDDERLPSGPALRF